MNTENIAKTRSSNVILLRGRVFYVANLLIITIFSLVSTSHVMAMPHDERTDTPKVSVTGYQPAVFTRNKARFDRYSTQDTENSAYKDLKLSHKRESNLLNIETHLKANYLGSADTTDEAVLKIDSLYLDASLPKYDFSMRLGRHAFSMADTKFPLDGMSISYKLFDKHRINLLAGLEQSESTDVEASSEKSIVGISAESARFARFWKANAYAFEKHDQGVIDSKIVGSKLHFLNKGHSASLQFDVDSAQLEARSSQLMFKLAPFKNHSIQLALDYRSPGSTTGMTVPALDELLKSLAEDEMNALEQDNDAAFRSGGLSWSKVFSDDLSLNGEVSVSSLSQSALDDGLMVDSYYMYGVQLKGRNLINDNDTASMSLSYLEFNAANRFSLSINNHLPFRPNWYANLQLDAYWQDNEDASQTTGVSPLLKFQYKQKDNAQTDIEFGMNHSSSDNLTDNIDNDDVFINITHTKSLW